MCVCIRCCLAAVVAAAAIFMCQITASDDNIKIPRISVAATAGPASQGGLSPGPAQQVLQEGAGDSVTGAAARKTQGLSQAISDPTLHSETSSQLATKAVDNNAGTVHEQRDHNKVAATQPKTENAMKDVPEFSITEVTKAKAISLPVTPQEQHETIPEQPTRTDPRGPHREAESADKQTKTESAKKDVVPEFSITEVTKAKAVSLPATPQEQHETPPEHPTRTDPRGPQGEAESANKQTKEAESQNPTTVTQITEPATTQVEPEHAKVLPSETSHPQTIEGSKGPVLKINASVSKMIKPVAGSSAVSPQVEPALRTGSPAAAVREADPVKHPTTNKAKVEGPDISSDSSEVSVKQPPAPLTHPLAANVNKGLDLESSVSDQPGGQPLTTIIKPVHAVQPGGGENPTQNTNITPVSGVPVNVLGESATTESKKLNAYTITSNEFAKKTAVAHAQKLEEESKESLSTVSDNMPDEHASQLETETSNAETTAPKTALQVTPTQGQDHIGDKSESKTPTDKIISTTTNGDEHQEHLKKITHNTVEEEKPLKSSHHTENLSLMTVSELVNMVSNELEAYSEEVTKKWNERREKVSWLAEAMEVLQTYNVKITETEKYSNCTTDDRKKYQDSKNSLTNIMSNCEMALKRKDWHELQEKTSNIVNGIRVIEEDYDAQISQIPKEDQHFDARKLVIEENAKRKLTNLNTESIKNDFSKLRDNALRIDEEDYKSCIDIKETDTKGTAIISEIRQAIMKIYDCV